jgi:hypothetical protein
MLKIGQVLDVPRQSVPFPGMGQRRRFLDAMARIVRTFDGPKWKLINKFTSAAKASLAQPARLT